MGLFTQVTKYILILIDTDQVSDSLIGYLSGLAPIETGSRDIIYKIYSY
jgi:hypothetical protein